MTYDDAESMTLKGTLAKQRGIGGIMMVRDSHETQTWIVADRELKFTVGDVWRHAGPDPHQSLARRHGFGCLASHAYARPCPPSPVLIFVQQVALHITLIVVVFPSFHPSPRVPNACVLEPRRWRPLASRGGYVRQHASTRCTWRKSCRARVGSLSLWYYHALTAFA